MTDTFPPEHWHAAAQTALQSLWGAAVTCLITDTLRNEGRNRVYRLAVTGGPVPTVILKASLGEDKHPYTPGDDRPNTPFNRFCNEWAGCAMLAPLGLGPIPYTGDAQRGFYLMEDLGQGISLADHLTSNDPAAATSSLLAYAHSLGELHARTQGQSAHWHTLRHARGGIAPDQVKTQSWAQELKAFSPLCRRLNLTLPESLDADLARIVHALDNPGPYAVFTPTDCCPDNHYLRHDRVIFFDCEWATMRHALLDTAYFLAPFPSCWCTSKLPDPMPAQLLAVYRSHFPGTPDFDDQLTFALAAWVLAGLTWNWSGKWEQEDRKWGLVTLRQRHLHRLENLLARPNLPTLLPALAPLIADLKAHFTSQWPDLEPMPLYPAFRPAL